jgi:hypothetical protein
MATTTRTIKSVKTSSIASQAYQADGVAPTLDVLESASIWAYIVSSAKLSIVGFWALIAGSIATVVYLKELSKKQD